jgi:hypothetical protein
MKRFALLSILALVLTSATTAQADPAPPGAALAPAPAASVTMPAAEFNALIAKVGSPAPTTAATILPTIAQDTTPGLFGFSWYQIIGYLVTGLLSLFGIIKGGQWLTYAKRAKAVLSDAIACAYWMAERNFSDLSGEQKAAAAMGLLYQQLEGHGIPLDPKLGAQAETVWAKMAAEHGAKADAIAAPAPAAAAQAAAEAEVARKVAQGATATDVLSSK